MSERWPDRVHVRVSVDQHEQLRELAERRQMTASSLVRQAVARLLSEHATDLVTADRS